MDEKTKIARINEVVTDYFENNPSETKIRINKLMPDFVAAGIFEYVDKKNGQALRKFLRELKNDGKLGLIPFVEAKDRTVIDWFVSREKSEEV